MNAVSSAILSPFAGVQAAVLVYAAAALAAAIGRGAALRYVYPACLAASALAIACSLAALIAGQEAASVWPLGLPGIGFRLKLDALSAFFALIVNIGVFAAALYGLGLSPRELSGRIEPFIGLFAAAMNMVLLADDAFAFLFFWELMSLGSWALVVAQHRREENRKAGQVYLLMAAMGTAALLFAFGGLSGPLGDYSFDGIRTAQRPALTSGLVLMAAIIGAGSKAGVAPLHAWLPLAHPAAPSHVSALMSGVMTKVAIYGVIRIVFDLLGPPLWWWALPLLALGAVTAVLGLLYAVLEGDVKRVLAYSTVENIGVIFVALGLALAFKAEGLLAAAAVAGAAALLHALYHSWFKTLLFLGAGAVLHGCGRRDLDGLGGLIHKMPATAAFFLAGTMSICALPPFNGFVSEWLLFQSVLAGPNFQEPLLRFLSPAVGALLALAAALAAACFVRVYGIAFLGRPRSDAAAQAHEAPRVQLYAMGLLAMLCLFGGLFSGVVVALIQPLLVKLAGVHLPGAGAGPTPLSLVAFDARRATYDAATIAIFLLVSGALTTLAVHRLSARKTRRGPAWDCGFPDPSPLTQYSASSFSQPLRRVYGGFAFNAREKIDMPAPGETRPARLTVSMQDRLWIWLYAAPARWVERISLRLNRFQFLTIRSYLVFQFSALIALLTIAVAWF